MRSCVTALAALAVLMAGILAAGCTTATVTAITPSATPTPYEVLTPPGNSLTGNWSGAMTGYDEGTGFTDYGNRTMTLVVTDERDRIFSGYMVLEFNGTTASVPVAGIISTDRQTFVIAEKGNGYTNGRFIDGNTIELDWTRDNPLGAAIDTLERA